MKKSLIIISSLIIVILVLTVTRAVVSNTLSTAGVDLSRVDQEIDKYQRSNALLQAKILQASAFTTLGAQATEKGYEAMSSQIVLTSPLPIAYKR